MKPYVLIAEDEQSLAELLTYNLQAEGFRTDHVEDGGEVLSRLSEEQPDLLLLDWMLPGLSGVEICRQIRRHASFSALPVVMLTARGGENDKVQGLEAGADDYVPKPFSNRELIARIRTVLRRSRPVLAGQNLVQGDIVLDPDSHRVERGGTHIHLGPTDYRLLLHFMENAARVQSRTRLLDAVWGMDKDVELRTVDVHVRRLRKALNEGGQSDPIRTVRSEGYVFEAASAVS